MSDRRRIIIDGDNVAYRHSLENTFSVRGLEIVIEYFRKKGHIVQAVVPKSRLKVGGSTNPDVLKQLKKDGYIILAEFTVDLGRRSEKYDKFILSKAEKCDGVIFSANNFRYVVEEKPNEYPHRVLGSEFDSVSGTDPGNETELMTMET